MGFSIPIIHWAFLISSSVLVTAQPGPYSVGQPIGYTKSYESSPAPAYYAQEVGSHYFCPCQVAGGYKGVCKPLATCAQYYGTPAHYNPYSSSYYQSCQYGYGSRGVCCPEIYYSGPKQAVLEYNPKDYGYVEQNTPVPREAVLKAIQYAQHYLDRGYRQDGHLGRNEDDPSYWGNGVAQDEYNAEVKPYGEVGFFIHAVTDYLHREYGYAPESFFNGGGLKLTEYAEYLPGNYSNICNSYYKQCSYSPYRSIDGSCNNLKNPYYGQANTILGRIRHPKYGDKVYGVRTSVDGYPLPTPRPLRYNALPDKNVEEASVSMLYVNFGQFVTHDLVHTPFYQADDGLFLDCCYGYQGSRQQYQVSPKCYALPVERDPFYSRTTKETCLNFARAVLGPNYDCTAGYSNPINIQTSHLDLSLQYGRGHKESNKLRLHKDGLLRLSYLGNQEYLPLDSNAECFNSSQGFCFASGDLRTTIHPGITVVQTLASRFHNVVAKQLRYLNPYWNDEKLYQEARKINIAVFQHITYSEYLPLLLGWKFMYDHGILPTTKGYSYAYDENAKPWIYAEFSGAAFRLHTSVYGNIILANEYYEPETELRLENYFNNAILLKNPQNFEKLLRGYILAPSRKHDKYYDPALTNYLLKDERHFGLDLASFNIHRGREYGLSSYNDYREICGLPRAYKWTDFYDWLDPKTVSAFKKIYRHPDDVDLYTGGVAERHFPDSLLGPTWWCIVGFQFQRLKLSDRFFYDLGNQPHSFTPAQLDEIRKMSISALLCLTTGLKEVPALGFRTISLGNPLVSCSDYEYLPRINFGPWKASSGHYEL